MITYIEALGYRSLRHVSNLVDRFQILVGPNASGKSTFLDVPAFLGDVLQVGVQGAIEGDPRLGIPSRASDARDLTWMRAGAKFEVAVEFLIPEKRRAAMASNGTYTRCRYEVAVDVRNSTVSAETLWLRSDAAASDPPQRVLFPEARPVPESIVLHAGKQAPRGWKKVVSRGDDLANVTFAAETSAWKNPFRIQPGRSALASLPEDETKFPVATWVKATLSDGIRRIVLSSEAMRRPSPPGRTRAFLPDGSNLATVVDHLEREYPDRLKAWVEHVRTALPDLAAIITRERTEDRHRYLVVKYNTGLEVPSWLVSDGTLRLLALTLLAYIPDLSGVYLIEEPENGIHPRAVEVVFQSLSSVYGAQILCATHSPVVLGISRPEQVLCFARNAVGATDIVRGDKHPGLREWRGEVDLGTLFASGVLG